MDFCNTTPDIPARSIPDRTVSIGDYRTDRLSFVHQIESLVYALERKHMRDQVVDIDPAVHVPIDDLRDIGPAARTAERRALPDAARDELERPRADLLPRTGDADNHRDPPAPVAAFQRLPHHIDVADAFEAVVRAPARELD